MMKIKRIMVCGICKQMCHYKSIRKLSIRKLYKLIPLSLLSLVRTLKKVIRIPCGIFNVDFLFKSFVSIFKTFFNVLLEYF